jgi:hypothetical protein
MLLSTRHLLKTGSVWPYQMGKQWVRAIGTMRNTFQGIKGDPN